jgi:peptide/nickel transport system substrate-binding protein
MFVSRFAGRHNRAWRVGACALALSIVVTACSSSKDSSSSSNSTGGGGSTGPKGTLVVDQVFNNDGLDPGHEAAVTSNMVFRGVYQTLLKFNGHDYTPVPDLALSFTSSADAKTYTFKLNPAAVFSDGTPVTSADVVFSFNRLINLQANEAFLLAGITPSAPDPHTVVLTSETSNPAIPRVVTTPELSILNSKVVQAQGGTAGADAAKSDKAQQWLNTHSAGSGPYVLSAVASKSQYTLVSNSKYAGTKPSFQTVVIRNVAAPAQDLNVQRGTDEIAYDITGTEADALAGKSGLQVVRNPSLNTFFMAMNLNPKVSAVTSNADIRQAVRYGLDYQALAALGGKGAVQLAGLIPQGVLGALPASDAVQRDVAKAKSLVAASGIANPKFSLNYIDGFSIFGVSLATVAQKVQASLAEVGITVVLRNLPLQEDIQESHEGKQQASVDLSAVDYPDPNDFLIDAPDGTASKNLGYTAAAYPQAASLASQAGVALQDTQRGSLFQQLQTSMNNDSPWIPEFQPESILVGSANLTNVVTNDVWGLDVAAVGQK